MHGIQPNIPIIGQPRKIEDVEPLKDSEIDEILEGVKQNLAQGTPLNIPAALPLGFLARIAATLALYRGCLHAVSGASDEVDKAEGEEEKLHLDELWLKIGEIQSLLAAQGD